MRRNTGAVLALAAAALLLPTGSDATLGDQESPAHSCRRILEASGGTAESGVYWLLPATPGSARKVWCEMSHAGMPWTVVFKYDKSVSAPALFDTHTPGGKLVAAGSATDGAGTYTFPQARAYYDQVAIACLDEDNKVKDGSFHVMSAAEWIGIPFVAGEGFPSTRQQTNPFGTSSGWETLFFASSSDWREINFMDTTNTAPTNTQCKGWCAWRNGQAQCAHSDVSSSNQLVLMTSEPPEDTRLFVGAACNNDYNSIAGACPSGSVPFEAKTPADFQRLHDWARLQRADGSTTYFYANVSRPCLSCPRRTQ